MSNEIDLTACRPAPLHDLGTDFSERSASGHTLAFNNYYMLRDGQPFLPVCGEFHYSRMDPRRWEDELIKTRAGGVDVVSTYIFWNHIEEREGVFDFTGRRDLRRFVELCAKHSLYVILRVGPFAHGEVRNGGLPDWLYGKPFEVRDTNAGFMDCVRRLYTNIAEQARALFFRDDGPIIAVQLDNEYMHSSAAWEMTTGISDEWINSGSEGENYMLALRELALACGLTPAFFTATAWGGAACSERIMPLWGGYAYRPWIFYSHKGEHPATEEYLYEDYHRDGATWADDFDPAYPPSSRPYACCEMGAGMTCCYYYRFKYPFKGSDALANIKLGSGCNFIGYYMYHGGTNPIGKGGTYLNEAQVPKLSYDYQTALGEFGQVRESWRRLRTLHYFTRFFGLILAPMETRLPEGASQIDPRNTETLRWAVRTDGQSGFLFVNNFQDHVTMRRREHDSVTLHVNGEMLTFDISLAPEENAILPFNLDLDGILLKQANAQPVLRTVIEGLVTYVFMIPDGMERAFTFEPEARVNGADCDYFTVTKEHRTIAVLVLTREKSDRLCLLRDGTLLITEATPLEDEDGGLRLESTEPRVDVTTWPGGTTVVETAPRDIPVAVERTAPCRYTLRLPRGALAGLKDARLQIDYRADIGHLFLNGTMIHDNFCNGDTWEIGLMEHREALDIAPLVLTLTPIREGANVNVESAMAGRSENVTNAVAELLDVRVQPVYEIRL